MLDDESNGESNSNKFELVDSEERLTNCQELCSEKLLALDTEFVRTNTFYGQLGLIQLYANQKCYLIDPIKVNAWETFVKFLRADKASNFTFSK